jgi:hypothetical protein
MVLVAAAGVVAAEGLGVVVEGVVAVMEVEGGVAFIQSTRLRTKKGEKTKHPSRAKLC